MLKKFHKLLSNQYYYGLSKQCMRYLGPLSLLLFGIGLYWSLVLAPADYQQGETYRIIFIHVPVAFLSLGLYTAMSVAAVIYLVWRIKMAGLMIRVFCLLGAVFTVLALITGSIWGKPMWGTWWIWDARLTSELILLILYLAIFTVYNSQGDDKRSAFIASIVVLVGFVDIPIIHYSVYWWNTLHQGATISLTTKPQIAPSMLYPLLTMLLAFSVYCAYMVFMMSATALKKQERHKRRMAQLLQESE